MRRSKTLSWQFPPSSSLPAWVHWRRRWAMSLPLSLGIVATDISQWQWGRKVEPRGGGWEKTKSASCSELGDENASCSELRDLQPPGFHRGICTAYCGARAHGWCAMAPRRVRDRLNLFPTTSEWYTDTLPNWQWVLPTRNFLNHSLIICRLVDLFTFVHFQ